MEFANYLSALRKWAWLVILAPLLAAAVSLGISLRMQPVYRASTTLLISQAGGPSLLDYNLLLTSERVAKTYAELLTKRPLLNGVISDLQLDLTPHQLRQKIDVVQPPNTQLLELHVEDSNPQLAIAIANGVAASFLEQNNHRESSDPSGYAQSLAEQIAEVTREIEDLKARLEERNASQRHDPSANLANAPEASRLEASLREARLTYATLLGSYLQVRATGGRSVNITIVEPAAMPASKVRPRVFFNTFVAALAGLTLALGFVLFLEYLEDRFTRPENAEQTFHIPTLAAIPSAQLRASRDNRPLAALQPRSPFAEAHRMLRTNIRFSDVDETADMLLITSALPKEGKTTTVANLGVVMAQAGMKVLLVDSDLRRAALHRAFGLPNQRGLTDLLLAHTVPDESCLLETTVPNLYLLPSGALPPTPSELLSSEQMGKLINHLCALADILLFDSPPVLAVTDATVLAHRLDGVLLVVESGRTPKEEVRKALTHLQNVDAKVLGTVLTRCNLGRSVHYYDGLHGTRRGGVVD